MVFKTINSPRAEGFGRKRIPVRSMFVLIAMISGLSPVTAPAQAVTGKIVVDGVVYGGSLVKGSGRIKKESRKLAPFKSVKVLTSIDVDYHPDGIYQVELSGDDNVIPIIKTHVEAGELIINSERNFQVDQSLTVAVSAPHLQALAINGASDTMVDGLKEDAFSLTISGSGDVKLSGQVKHAQITVTGSGDVDAAELMCDFADVQLQGAGDIDIFVKEKLSAEILGSGTITYYGGPTAIEKQVLGSGEIEAGD